LQFLPINHVSACFWRAVASTGSKLKDFPASISGSCTSYWRWCFHAWYFWNNIVVERSPSYGLVSPSTTRV